MLLPSFFFFFFNDTATTEIYTLSLHDALPIYAQHHDPVVRGTHPGPEAAAHGRHHGGDGEDRQDHARPGPHRLPGRREVELGLERQAGERLGVWGLPKRGI